LARIAFGDGGRRTVNKSSQDATGSRPHPNLLPLGEGIAVARLRVFARSSGGSSRRLSKEAVNVKALSLGEAALILAFSPWEKESLWRDSAFSPDHPAGPVAGFSKRGFSLVRRRWAGPALSAPSMPRKLSGPSQYRDAQPRLRCVFGVINHKKCSAIDNSGAA
jgi:hypothetical protein